MRANLSRDPVVFVELTCALCAGRGSSSFDTMPSHFTCCACGGSGKIRVRAPAAACAHCRGTGAVKTLICSICGGRGFVLCGDRGFVPQSLSPTVSCPACKGSGADALAPAMACLKCRGTGWMIKPFKEGEGGS